jgi:hypothetical protein
MKRIMKIHRFSSNIHIHGRVVQWWCRAKEKAENWYLSSNMTIHRSIFCQAKPNPVENLHVD